MPPFESHLTFYREQARLSRDELARLVRVSRQTIANIELGRSEPGVLLGMAIANVLGVSVADLFRPRQKAAGHYRRYRFHASPGPFFNPYAAIPLFNPEALTQAIRGAQVRAFVQLPLGQGYEIELQLQRETHDEALDEIALALDQVGLQLVRAYAIEVTTAAIETAMAAGGAGGLIGSGTKDGGATLAGALLGAAIGAALGSQIERVTAAYTVTKPYPSSPWHLVPIPLREPGSAEGQTG